MTTIQVRVDEDTKQQATVVLEGLGLDMSTAMKIFLRQVIIRNGIPFEIKMGNPDMLAAIEEVEKIKRGELKAKRYNSFAELVKELEEEIEQEAEENV